MLTKKLKLLLKRFNVISRFLNDNTMDFQTVKAALEANSIVLIDVRGLEEVKSDGKIPGSQNVPIGEISSAFEMDESSFKSKYEFDKPSKNTSIVTSCKIGGRASRASSTLIDLGYTNVKVYGGSLKDWKENNGPVE